MAETLELYATIGVGVENITSRELQNLGLTVRRVEPGRVRFSGSFADLYRTVIHLRTASRVVRELHFTEISRDQDIYDVVRALPWPSHFGANRTFRVVFNAHSSLIVNSLFWTYRIKDAICDRFVDDTGKRPDVDTEHPDVAVYCYLENRRLSIGLDASGDPLHMRSYRVVQHRASLREHLAAAMVLHTGWNQESLLHDPFCGSGTIPIEAALLATHTPPSMLRTKFACMGWEEFDARLFSDLRDEAKAAIRPVSGLRLTGADLDGEAIEGAKRNAEAAGVASYIDFRQESVADMPVLDHALIVTNPPYGVRLEDDDILTCFRELRERALLCKGSKLAVLNAHPAFEKTMSLRPFKKNRMNNGSIACTLYQYQIME